MESASNESVLRNNLRPCTKYHHTHNVTCKFCVAAQKEWQCYTESVPSAVVWPEEMEHEKYCHYAETTYPYEDAKCLCGAELYNQGRADAIAAWEKAKVK